MRYFFFTLTFVLLCSASHAQNLLMYGGARSQAMSDASVTFSDVFASFNNQAALAYLTKSKQVLPSTLSLCSERDEYALCCFCTSAE